MKQAKINGGASSQVPTFRFPIMDEPPLRMQRTPAPYFMNGQSERPRKRFAYESPIEELYYDRSVVPMEKPLGKMELEVLPLFQDQDVIDLLMRVSTMNWHCVPFFLLFLEV